MLQRDRLPDQNFSKWHELYKRFGKEDFVEDRLIPARIPYRNSSVNWSKYSKPWDVIFEYPQMGFCRILVRNLPRELLIDHLLHLLVIKDLRLKTKNIKRGKSIYYLSVKVKMKKTNFQKD